jgi:hypothetical protein
VVKVSTCIVCGAEFEAGATLGEVLIEAGGATEEQKKSARARRGLRGLARRSARRPLGALHAPAPPVAAEQLKITDHRSYFLRT